MKWVRILAAAAALSVSASAAQASLIGDTVNINYYYPDLASQFSSDSVVVGAGSELVCPGAFSFCNAGFAVDVDFVADSVTVRWETKAKLNPAAFSGFSFEDLDFGAGLVLAGVALDTNMAGLDASAVSFGDDFARINLQGLSINSENFFALNFTTRGVAVPEPGAVGLLGLGLLGLGLALRRRTA